MRFLLGSFVDFCPLFFQSSTLLSLRFGRVVRSELFRLREVYCVDSARIFYIGFASRNFFLEFCLSYPCFFEVLLVLARLFGENFRERTSE